MGRVYLFALAMHKSVMNNAHNATRQEHKKSDLYGTKIRVTFICEHEVKSYDEHASVVAVSTIDLYL